MKDIEIIAFDADDTLWSNEPFFQEIERKFADLLSIYKDTKETSAELFKTEMNNLESYGYGAKGFTLSMIETALRISNHKVSAEIINEILSLGKSLLNMPIELLPGVEETLRTLKQSNRHRLIVRRPARPTAEIATFGVGFLFRLCRNHVGQNRKRIC